MPSLKYVIELSEQDRAELIEIVRKGKRPARTILRANILLASDRGSEKYMTVTEISRVYHTTPTTVQTVRTSYCEKGLEATINRKKRETPPVPAKVTGEVEAHVIALACSEPPEGYSKWTLRLLANKTVELGYIDSISHVTVSTILKNEFKPNLKKCWCIPPEHNAAFVAAMEDVLAVYSRPYDESHPVVCMDEKPVQFFADFRKGFRSKKNGVVYEDYQYIRNGTACIFLFTEPLAGWRYADAQERRTQQDWARQIEWLLTEQYPAAEKVVLVMDNLNTHSIAALYATFSPQHARQLAERLEIHYTPKHGSWLDIAEIELSALGRQCIANNRIPDLPSLRNLLVPWASSRNSAQKGVDWHFSTNDARSKLKHLYPVVEI